MSSRGSLLPPWLHHSVTFCLATCLMATGRLSARRTPAYTCGLELLTKLYNQSAELYNNGEGPYYRAFSWLKAGTTAFTFKTLLRHYAKWVVVKGR